MEGDVKVLVFLVKGSHVEGDEKDLCLRDHGEQLPIWVDNSDLQ